MNHSLQVVGQFPDSYAKCSCGSWEKHSEAWEWKDGNYVRAKSWEDFEAHAKQQNENLTKCFHVVGWHANIHTKDRNSRNLSDGAVFSSMDLAKNYVLTRDMTVLRVDPIMIEATDERIDYFVKSADMS